MFVFLVELVDPECIIFDRVASEATLSEMIHSERGLGPLPNIVDQAVLFLGAATPRRSAPQRYKLPPNMIKLI